MKTLICLILVLLNFEFCISTFSYKSQDDWGESCKIGLRQSPINIVVKDAVDDIFTSLKLVNFDKPIKAPKIRNTGKRVEILLSNENKFIYYTSYLQKSTYKVEKLIFRSSNDKLGSEHTINGQRGVAEGQLITYNTKYSSYDEARKYIDGVLIIAVIFNFDNSQKVIENNSLRDLIRNAEKVGSEFTSNLAFDLRNLFPLRSLRKSVVVNYEGSTTTPGCKENVNWLVFTTPIYISQIDVDLFSKINYEENDTENYRKLQKLNGRVVKSFRNVLFVTKIKDKINVLSLP